MATADLEALERELTWFAAAIDARFTAYFPREPGAAPGVELPPPPEHGDAPAAYARLLRAHPLAASERLALALALAAELRPQLLDVFFVKNATFDRRFSEFGGARIDDDFTPTGETLAFLLDAGSLAARAEVVALLDPERPLRRLDLLRAAASGGPSGSPLKSPLRLAPDVVVHFLGGARRQPALDLDFPAARITTALEWEDLVLNPSTLRQLRDIEVFLAHGATLMRDWGMAPRLRPGHRALFHGPPGTGKTMSAALLGKLADRDVYRVDLSQIVSKYIGETAKNLARVFDGAQRGGWILFFDEADALFGRRSAAKDAHDRYANQETAFLLQRIESFDGVTILASNLPDNLDDAFARRFESVVYFPLPRPPERLRLWERGLSPRARLDPRVDLAALADAYELSGAAIMNVLRRVSLAAIAAGERPITPEDLIRAIRYELAKEGRSGG
ncbi:MAG: ATP-binding protein [Myxococcales bacterium]|nr:ATP-binding protein [Myxococcales bacterium]